MSRLEKCIACCLLLSTCYTLTAGCNKTKKCSVGMVVNTEHLAPVLFRSQTLMQSNSITKQLTTIGDRFTSSLGAVVQRMVIRLSRPPSQPGAVESSRTYTDYSQKDGTYRHVEVITGSMAVAMMARGGGGGKTSNFRGLLCCLLMAAWLGLTESSGIKARKRELYIAGLFPFTGTHGSVGRGVKPAVDLALRHVNNDRSILPEYELKITFNDSKCDMAVATKAFFDLTYDNATTDAILFGDACYSVTGPMAEISREWGMFQLSYGDTDPLLSDRDKYPNFFRTVPSDSDYNPARLALLRHFNWSSVGTLFQDASQGGAARYGYAHNRFDSLMEKHTINVSKVESFADDPSTAIQNLRDHDIRIIVGNFAENMARKVFCSARQRGMYGPRHQWIILGDYSPDWWKITDSTVPCTPEMLNDTLDGYLATAVMPLSTDEELTEWGKTPEEYKRLYDLERGSEYSVYHGYAYDGIWVIAHALHRLLREEEMREGSNMAASLEELLRGARVGKALNDTNIRGVTGRVQFNNGDRVGVINILQMQAGKMVKVAEYNTFTEQLDFSKGEAIIWRGGRVPRDRTIQYEEMRHVSTPIYLTLVALSSIGVIMACCFLGLNIRFRRHRFIKMSSPNMNNIIIVGCILCYLSIVLLGTDGSIASSSPVVFRYWCRARAWVLALGFTLAFGAMFGKTWRVHAIFTNIKLNKKVIKDYKLMLLVLVLVLVDVGILITWQVIDPFEKAEKKLSPEVYTDYEVIPKLEYCSSHHMEIWLGSIYAYKGLLLAFGCFLAWETRHVSIPALNDSKYIGLSVYNVVIMCTCGAAVTFVIKDQPTHSFVIIAVFIIFATTATLCLVFVPKIIQLRRDPKGEEKRIRATLRKPSPSVSLENDRFQQQVKVTTEENRRLRGFLEQKAKELEHLLEQLGEDGCGQDAHLRSASALHKKILELRTSDVSPSKVSRTSSHSDVELTTSTASEISEMTSSYLIPDSPPGGRQLKSRILNSRMYVEAIEMAEMRRKSSCTIPPPAEEEVEEDDPFGGVYLGPAEPLPPKRQTVSLTRNSSADHQRPVVTTPTHVYDGGGRNRRDFQVYDELNQERSQHISVPSFIGPSSKTPAPPTRSARATRRQSAPLTMWPISETGEGEEGHYSRLDNGPDTTTRPHTGPNLRGDNREVECALSWGDNRDVECELSWGDNREVECADRRFSLEEFRSQVVNRENMSEGEASLVPVPSHIIEVVFDDFSKQDGSMVGSSREGVTDSPVGSQSRSVDHNELLQCKATLGGDPSFVGDLMMDEVFVTTGFDVLSKGRQANLDTVSLVSTTQCVETLQDETSFIGTTANITDIVGRENCDRIDSLIDIEVELKPGSIESEVQVEVHEQNEKRVCSMQTTPSEPLTACDAVPYAEGASVSIVSVLGDSASAVSDIFNDEANKNHQTEPLDILVNSTKEIGVVDSSVSCLPAMDACSTVDVEYATMTSCQHLPDSPNPRHTLDESPQSCPAETLPPRRYVTSSREEAPLCHGTSGLQDVVRGHVTSCPEEAHGCRRDFISTDLVFHEQRTMLSAEQDFSKIPPVRQVSDSVTAAQQAEALATQKVHDNLGPCTATQNPRCEGAARGVSHPGVGFSVQVYPEHVTQVHPEQKVAPVAEYRALEGGADATKRDTPELSVRASVHCSVDEEEQEFWASPATMTMVQSSPNPRVTFKCDVIENL